MTKIRTKKIEVDAAELVQQKEKRKAYFTSWRLKNKEKINTRRRVRRRLFYAQDKEKINAQKRAHYAANRDKIRIQRHEYYATNCDKINQAARTRRKKNTDKSRAYSRTQYYKHREKRLVALRENYPKHREKILKRIHKKYIQDTEFRNTRVQYCREWRKKHPGYVTKHGRLDIQFRLANRFRTRLRDAIRENYRKGSTVELLGCAILELKKHLEKQFQPGMTWNNWSPDGWHIDHIRSLAEFDLQDIEQLKCACHYTNLRPLWAKDNLARPRPRRKCQKTK